MDPRDLRLPPTEAAMIVSLIDRLKPEVALEIGTFFGQTALQMAEAIAKNGKGKLITIDPFGESRVPGIIKTWPAEAQAVTEFQPMYSMQFFATLEAKMTRGGYTSLGVVFVDGNHAFEYALYDILSAAANVTPGGAIIVDNLEQLGPKLAVFEFMRMNRAWKFFHGARLYDADDLDPWALRPEPGKGIIWGVLLAPEGIPVTAKGYKARGKFKTNPVLNGLRLNVHEAKQPTQLAITLLYVCRPYDFHIKGEGAKNVIRKSVAEVGPDDQTVDVIFEPPIAIEVSRSDMNYTYQLEMTPLDRDGRFVILDGDSPYTFLSD